jgi:hypothetical protein
MLCKHNTCYVITALKHGDFIRVKAFSILILVHKNENFRNYSEFFFIDAFTAAMIYAIGFSTCAGNYLAAGF